MPDQILIERWIQSRDGEAFKLLVDGYGAMVYATGRRVLGNPEDAEDLAQECFAVLSELKAPPKAPLGPWLHRVATNRALNRIKSNRARATREVRYAAETRSADVPPWNELESLIDEALAELPEPLRDPVVGHYLLGKSHAAIAQELGLSRQSVTYRIAQALEKLREILRKRGVSLTGAALAVFLEKQAVAQMPANLSISLAKTALATACGAAQAPASFPMKGVLAMTTMNKAGLGALLVCVALAAVMTVNLRQTATEHVPIAVPPASTEPIPEPDVPNASVAESEPLPEPRVVGTASQVQAPPIAGLWTIESYTFNRIGRTSPTELLDVEEHPQARIETDGDRITLTVLSPWDEDVSIAKLTGTRDDHAVKFRAGVEYFPVIMRGRFSANWTELTFEGGPDLKEASPAYLERRTKNDSWEELLHYYMALKRVGDVEGAPILAAAEELDQRRNRAKTLAEALHGYVTSHDGELPAELADLVPDYLSDAAILEPSGKEMMQYNPSDLRAGQLVDTAQWDSFEPDAPMPQRLEDWETYQTEVWGATSPVLPPVLTIEYERPYLQFSIDALGTILERDYRLDSVTPELASKMRENSQGNLLFIGMALKLFQSTHDEYLPAGWLSLLPRIPDVTMLTHPADPPGTISYELLFPATSVDELADAQAESVSNVVPGDRPSNPRKYVPVVAEVNSYAMDDPGCNVLFADGSARWLSMEQYARLRERWGLD